MFTAPTSKMGALVAPRWLTALAAGRGDHRDAERQADLRLRVGVTRTLGALPFSPRGRRCPEGADEGAAQRGLRLQLSSAPATPHPTGLRPATFSLRGRRVAWNPLHLCPASHRSAAERLAAGAHLCDFMSMRPHALTPLFAEATALPGVGPKLAPLLDRLLGEPGRPARIIDLLFHLPYSVVDRSARRSCGRRCPARS